MNAGSQTPEWLSQAVSIIKADLRKHLTIREIAARVGTNSYSLKRTFKEVYGMGPYEYLVEIRLQKASELLLQMDYSVKTISKQVGYRSPSSFVAMFKRKTNMSPLLWKNRQKSKGAERNNKPVKKKDR
jgi:AraC-like DNA-binding protein